MGIYAGVPILGVLTTAYGLQRLSDVPRVQKALPRPILSLLQPKAAGTVVSIGLALAVYFGLVTKEIEG